LKKVSYKVAFVKTVSDKVVRHSLAYLSACKKYLAKDVPYYVKICPILTNPLPKNSQPIFARNALSVTSSEKIQLERVAIASHCNLRPPQPRQSFSAFITTPCQVWSRWTYPLPYYSVFAADTLLYTVTLTYDLWPLIFAVYPVTWWNFVPNLNAIEQSAAELLQFQYLT